VEGTHAVIRRGIAGIVVALLSRRGVAAQTPVPTRYAEYRVDGIMGGGTTAQAGFGVVVPLGIYVRLGIDAAGGATWSDDASRGSGRVDVIGRFLLDPFREAPVGLSLGGGVSVPYVDGQKTIRPYLTAVVDIEGRMRGRLTPALQLGLGGGTRIGLVLRTSPARWR